MFMPLDNQLFFLFPGSYPYEAFPSVEKLRAAKSLPPIEAWYNSLTEEHLAPDAYEHAKKVWSFFQCSSMEDYMKIYLVSDVFILCEIFEIFRDIVQSNFDLDPAWFLGIPGLAFQSFLKMTGAEVELVHDPDLHDFIDRALRGGVSVITKRYVEGDSDIENNQEGTKILYIE